MPWRLTEADAEDKDRGATIDVDGDLSADEIFYLEGDLLLSLNTDPSRQVTLDLRRFTPSDFSLFAALYSIRKRIKSEHPLRILVIAGSEAAETLKQGRFTGIFEVVEEPFATEALAGAA